MLKNQAGQQLTVFAFVAATNLPAAGEAANLTAFVDKDDAGVVSLADTSAVENAAVNAKGYYTFSLSQAETNADKLLFTAICSTPGIIVIAVPGVVYPDEPGGTLTISAAAPAQSAILMAKQGRNFTNDIVLVNADDDAVVPLTADLIRAIIGREGELGVNYADAALVVVSGSDTPNGSSFRKNVPQSGMNRLRLDAEDLSFAPGVYTLFVDFQDSNDAADWKGVSRYVFILERT